MSLVSMSVVTLRGQRYIFCCLSTEFIQLFILLLLHHWCISFKFRGSQSAKAKKSQ